jgi:hypothetical protein
MTDDPRLADLGKFTPEGRLTPGYGQHYLFMVGRDDCHGVMLWLLEHEKFELDFNQYGYDDEALNAAIMNLLKDPNVIVQGTLDRSQAGGVHEKRILVADETSDPEFSNSIAIGQSATHSISHTKGGVCVGLNMAFEGSMNWSADGEGTGVSLKPGINSIKGYRAQNNTLLVSTNPIMISRFRTQLAVEHRIAQQQEAARELKTYPPITVTSPPSKRKKRSIFSW